MKSEAEAPALRAFEIFAAAGASRLSTDTIETYKSVWRQWASWLAARELTWHTADESAVRSFLDSLKARAHGTLLVSAVTKRRYWRILRDVYGAINAADDGPRAAIEFPRARRVGAGKLEADTTSMLFVGEQMVTLRNALRAQVDVLHSDRTSGRTPQWTELRDAALIAVLMSTAAKVAELRHLVDNDLHDHSTASNRSAPGEIRFVTLRSSRTLRDSAKKSVPIRKLELDETATRALRLWNDYREYAGLRTRFAPIFIGGAGRSGPTAKSLSAVSVFHIVARFVARAIPSGASSFHHVGPESVRNSVIREWIDRNIDEVKILEDAGVRDPKILRRLRIPRGPNTGA
jgi:hypothetical protein